MAQVISDNSLEVLPWDMPEVSDQRSAHAVSQRSAIEEEGFQQGYEEGLENARQLAYEDVVHEMRKQFSVEWENQLALLKNILQRLNAPRSQVTEDVEDAILKLVEELSIRLVRSELNLNKGKLRNIIHDAVQLLPIKNKTITIGLSSHDYQYFSTHLQGELSDFIDRFVEMSELESGDFRVMTEESEIDGSVYTRFTALLNHMTDAQLIDSTVEADDA